MIKNQYSLELLEKRLNESDSLAEHIMIACDLIEYQVNVPVPVSADDFDINPNSNN